jgi:hypothetical protein
MAIPLEKSAVPGKFNQFLYESQSPVRSRKLPRGIRKSATPCSKRHEEKMPFSSDGGGLVSTVDDFLAFRQMMLLPVLTRPWHIYRRSETCGTLAFGECHA